MGSEIKVALLCEETLYAWQIRALEKMLDESDTQIEYVVVNRERNGIREKIERVRRAKAYALMAGLRRLSAAFLGEEQLHRSVRAEDVQCLQQAEFFGCIPTPSEGLGVELPTDVVDRISSCDVIVRFGFGIIKGNVLTAPKHGVLSYHHGDIRRYRGRPAGFWEFMQGVDECGITLQQLAPELDKGRIVRYKSIDISRSEPYQSIKRRLFMESIDMLAKAMRDIERGSYDPVEPDTTGELYTPPSFIEYLYYLSKNIPLVLQYHVRRRFEG